MLGGQLRPRHRDIAEPGVKSSDHCIVESPVTHPFPEEEEEDDSSDESGKSVLSCASAYTRSCAAYTSFICAGFLAGAPAL